MDLDLLKQVNRLWHRIYPYLADQIFEIYQRDFGKMLELGPFSGGISLLTDPAFLALPELCRKGDCGSFWINRLSSADSVHSL